MSATRRGLIEAQPESERQSGDQRDGEVSKATADHSAFSGTSEHAKRRVTSRVMQSKAGRAAPVFRKAQGWLSYARFAPGSPRALQSEGWHIAQHISFVVASLLFWVAMLRPRRGGYLLSAACLFVTSLIEGALGALMALSTSPWYASYARMDLSGIGLDPTTDQQLAGLLMWIPGGLLHGGVAIFLLYKWLKASNSEGRYALRAH